MTSNLCLKSEAWIAMKVLKEKDKQGLSLQKSKARKLISAKIHQQHHANSSMETRPFGGRSFIWASKHLRSTPSDMFRVAYSWEMILNLMRCEISHQEGLLATSFHQMVGDWDYTNKKQLLLCQPLGGKTFSKSPQFISATIKIVLSITRVSIT